MAYGHYLFEAEFSSAPRFNLERPRLSARIYIMKPIYFAGVACAIGIAIFIIFTGKEPKATPQPHPSIGEEIAERTFTGNFTTGYEGEFYKVAYALRYPADFAVENPSNNKTKILLSRDGEKGVIALVWNGAAGFSSGEEAWEAIGPLKNCTPLSMDLGLPQADRAWYGECEDKIAAAYFDRPSGIIVVAAIAADRSFAETILSALTITTSPTAQPSL